MQKTEDAQVRIAELEAEITGARRQLEEAQALARIGSWEWDIPRNLVWWSDELFRVYGLEPRSIVPTYEKFLAHVHPDDRDDVDARNRKAFEDHQPFEDVKRVVRDDDGREILMRTQGEVILSAEGEPLRMVGICEDVTDAVRARDADRAEATAQALRHRAYQINDEIIQQLVVALMHLKRDERDEAMASVDAAHTRAQAIVDELLGDEQPAPGDLRRDDPAAD